MPWRLLAVVRRVARMYPGAEGVASLALCGVSIVAYSPATVDAALSVIRDVLARCIRRGYVEESMHVKSVIDSLKREREDVARLDQLEAAEEEIDERLGDAIAVRDNGEWNWNNQLAQLDAERDLAVLELEMKWQEARDALDETWRTEKMKDRYNKPSARLIELRRVARTLLRCHRFEETARVADEIDALEKSEAEDSAKRMAAGYEHAVDRLNRKFENDLDTLRSMFTTRRNQIERSRDARMMPVTRKVSKYTKKKEALEQQQKRKPKLRLASTPERPGRQTTIAAKSAKLQLPPIRTAKRKESALAVPRPKTAIAVRKTMASGPNVPDGRQSRLARVRPDDSE
jgi:hypothetical protein